MLFSLHPGLQSLAQLFLVAVAVQACNKLGCNESEAPAWGDASACGCVAGAGAGLYIFTNIDRMAEVFRFTVITKVP